MEEIALVFSSLAGACTAVALDKIPKRKLKQTVTVSAAVENQLHSLNIEKEILTKTITRLHNDESNISKVQRDKLLLRYQHQLGAIAAKIEKLEIASRYPDLGPVGDSIISMMDSKLSKLDQRLHEISSKITVNTVQPAPQVAQPTVQPQATVQPQPVQQARQEPPRQIVQERPRPERIAPQIETRQETIEVEPEKIPEPPAIHLHVPERHVSVELSTLTTVPNKMPEFPAEFIKPASIEVPKHVEIAPKLEVPQVTEPAPKIEIPKPVEIPKQDLSEIVPVEPTPLVKTEDSPLAEAPKPEPAAEKKVQMPTPIKIPDEEKIEDDDKDLDKIKSEIMRALSKLEQVEVE